MKILKTGALCVLTCLCYAHASAQSLSPVNEPDYNKPKVFADLPNKMGLNAQSLDALLNFEVGGKVQYAIAPAFNFQGVVVSKSDAADLSSKTVVIKSVNRQGATLTFTRNLNADGTYTYRGRIISFKHGDAFEVTEDNGQLVLLKKSLYEMFNE